MEGGQLDAAASAALEGGELEAAASAALKGGELDAAASAILVWFPDPSVMRMHGRGKKGLGNNYTPARALEFDLHVLLSGCG